MQDKNDGVGGLPAIALQVGIEDRDRGFVRGALLEELPGGEDRAVGIGKTPAHQLFKRNVGIVLLGKFADFFRFGLGNFLCKSVSQLFKKLFLAGHCQRIHDQPLVSVK